jgi:hypothetical protein
MLFRLENEIQRTMFNSYFSPPTAEATKRNGKRKTKSERKTTENTKSSLAYRVRVIDLSEAQIAKE